MCTHTHRHDVSMGTDKSAPVNRMNLKRTLVYAEAFVTSIFTWMHVWLEYRTAAAV